MKKSLLLAAFAALTVSAYAQDVKLTQLANFPTSVINGYVTNDMRQGFGYGDKFYLQDHTNQCIRVFNAKGEEQQSYPETGANTAITRDEAGNLITTGWGFAGTLGKGANLSLSFYVTKADGSETRKIEGILPITYGRLDMIGFAKGDVFSAQGGTFMLQGASGGGDELEDEKSFTAVKVTITNGTEATAEEINTESGWSATSSTVLNYWKSATIEEDGEPTTHDYFLYVTRNANPAVADVALSTANNVILALPSKGACNGAQAFTMGSRDFVIYPTAPNYQDGFAIAEISPDADGNINNAPTAPVVEVEATSGKNANGFQSDWLNVEVLSDTQAKVYQFYPGNGGYCRIYGLTIGDAAEPVITAIKNINADENTEAAKVTYYTPAGVASNTPHKGLNIVVTKLANGTQKVVKVVK